MGELSTLVIWCGSSMSQSSGTKIKWLLDVFPGSDGVVQSTKIQTSNGIFVRPAVKLAPLFDDCFQRENRAGHVGARDRETNLDQIDK